jgi:hypothetical protein
MNWDVEEAVLSYQELMVAYSSGIVPSSVGTYIRVNISVLWTDLLVESTPGLPNTKQIDNSQCIKKEDWTL